MKKNLGKQLMKTVFLTCGITLSTLAFVAPVSCRLTEEGVEITTKDTVAPAVESFSVSGSKSLLVSCSEKIVLDKISVFEIDEASFDSEQFSVAKGTPVYAVADCVTYSEDGKTAEIELSSETAVGKSYIFSGTVYDITGNSLDFCQKFCGYNGNPAKLIFNEVRTTYSKAKLASEYVEFYVLKGGNTYGLELVSAANGEAKKYAFPSIEVKQGEYIVVHGRIFEEAEETSIDELGDDLKISTAFESCDSARDLWKSGADKIASNTDVLVLRDGVSGDLKDAVLLSAAGKTEWSKKLMTEFAESAVSAGIWKGGSLPENAVCTDGMTTSLERSISRQNTAKIAEKYSAPAASSETVPSSAEDWIVTDKVTVEKEKISGATPGYENSTNPYVK